MDLEKNEIKKKRNREAIKEKINAFLARYFNWLLALVVILVLASGFFFVLKPKYDSIASLTEANEFGQEQEYASRRQYLNKIKNLINVYKKISPSDIKKVNLILGSRDIPEELFPQIETLVLKNGLLLESLKIEPEELVKNSTGISLTKKTEDISLPTEIGKVKASLSVVGVDYFSLKSLISAMENNLIVTDIISVNFSPENESAELVFYSYYLKK